jgi:hypothetical protein
MEGGFSLISLVVWVLILAGIFRIAAITPWRPLRMVLNGFGILLAALSLAQILWWFLRS